MNPGDLIRTMVAKGSGYRWPFTGLFLLATCGILCGECAPISPSYWAVLTIGCLCPIFIGRGRLLFSFGVIFFFAALQAGSQQWSGSYRLLQWMEPTPVVLEAEGIVLSPPRILGRVSTFTVGLDKLWSKDGSPVPVNAKVTVRLAGAMPAYGDRIRAVGTFRALARPRNPGEFDFATWQHRLGIWAEWRVSREADGKILSPREGNPLFVLALRTRAWMSSVLQEGMSENPEGAAVVQAMTLGEVRGLNEQMLEDFRITGTLHLFSVSGLHVAMLGVMLWFGLNALHFPRNAIVLITIGLLFFYATITGLNPSSLRAAFMAAVVLAGQLLDRPASPINSLAAAGFLLLIMDTNILFNQGFQLSFGVVFSILLIGVPLTRWLRKETGPDVFLPRKLYSGWNRLHAYIAHESVSLLAVSFSAWLGSLPLIYHYYGLISFLAIPANFLAVPIAFFILALAVMSLLAGTISLGLAWMINHANFLLTAGLIAFIDFTASIPGGSMRLGKLQISPPDAELVFFDFGAGEANAFLLEGRAYLIDTGSLYQWKSTLQPWLFQNGVNQLDGLFLTHGDAKHIGAAQFAVEMLHPRFIGSSSLRDRSKSFASFQKWLETSGHAKRLLFAGDHFPIATNWTVEVLYPPSALVATSADDKTLVLKFQNPKISILLMNDAGLKAEDWLLTHARMKLPADVLVVGNHHGDQPSREDFLVAVAPKAVIASSVNFPTSETLSLEYEEMLKRLDISLFRKDQTGAIIGKIYSDHAKFTGFLPSPHQSCIWQFKNP